MNQINNTTLKDNTVSFCFALFICEAHQLKNNTYILFFEICEKKKPWCQKDE